ncbi:MAG: dihydroneopterin aldolase [Kiritimatiellia bacterium]
MDKIIIRDIAVQCIIGVHPEERTRYQRLLITLELDADLMPGIENDNIIDTLNYQAVCEEVASFATSSRFWLIETLAAQLAEKCLDYQRVSAAAVTVTKPEAIPGASGVSVCIRRSR